jgi:hypothetical protein
MSTDHQHGSPRFAAAPWRRQRQRGSVVLAALALSAALMPTAAEAGPLVRRAQERRACQEFARQLQASSGNPAQAQQIYQQGVLKLVAQFGDNPCGDIPAPMAATTTAPAANPTASNPTAATPTTAPATSTPAAAAPTTAAPAPSAEQQQACQEFARRLQAVQGDPAQARQLYATGNQRLSSRFGANPCPAIPQP